MQFRHMLRRLLRTPGFTLTTLLTLAIGIAANTAIFSVLDNVLLKPLPYPKPNELIGVWLKSPPLHFEKLNMSPSLYYVLRDENHSFTDIGLWNGNNLLLSGIGAPEQIPALDVTDGTLPLLGVKPFLGRSFSRQDDSAQGSPTVMLTYGFWQSKFAGDRSIIGRHILLDGTSREIIGVLPASFRFLDWKVSLVKPFQFDRAKLTLGNFSFQCVGRLRPGVTMAQANADVNRVIPISYTRYPPFAGYTIKMFEEAQIGAHLNPFKEDLVGDIGNVLWVLMGTMGLVLTIACANVANLLLVRTEGRQQELAVRTALGATSAQISRELLLESVLIGLAAGAIGLGAAYFALCAFVANVQISLPRLDEITVNLETVVFALAVSLISGVLFGLIPILKYTGFRLSTALRAGGRNSSQSREQHRARGLLVVVQVALALVLLISSGLMIRTFQALRQVQPGFSNPAQLQTFSMYINDQHVKQDEQVLHAWKEILRKLQYLPGVSSVGILDTVPMTGSSNNDPIFAEDHFYSEGQVPAVRRFNRVTPGTFQTIGNPLIVGRDFTWNDIDNYQPVAIISENLARELWNTPAAALGKRIRENKTGPWRTVIGVVHDCYYDGVNVKAPTTVYWPLVMKNFDGDNLSIRRGVSFVIRSSQVGSEGFLKSIHQAILSFNTGVPIANVNTFDNLYSKSLARTSLTLIMLAIAGCMALLLGVIGIYGVISYSVTQRTREIGIRLAIGAQQQQVTRMFVQHGLVLSLIGVAAGLAVAFATSRLLSSLLFGVQAVDPLTYAIVGLGLIACAMLASYLPARRVADVDPSDALRAE